MKHAIYTMMLAVGCGGDPFSGARAGSSTDAAPDVEVPTGTGGAESDAGGSGPGGTSSGGAPSGGASSGGVIAAGGAVEVEAGPADGGLDDAGGTGGALSSGGSSGSGGSTSTEDAGSTGGTGGAISTGGSVSTGGATATGGTTGCELVEHYNGLGETWEDCVPAGTFNAEQAMKACSASSDSCVVAPCGVCAPSMTPIICWQMLGPAGVVLSYSTTPMCTSGSGVGPWT